MRGLFIALLGINNLGKTTQAKMLTERIIASGFPARHQKYAIYELDPTGPLINEYLRKGNPYGLSAETFQTIQMANRLQFQNTLLDNLAAGVTVVAEDYTGTSVAWGVAAGVSKEYLVRLNSQLYKPDITILLDGEPFGSGREKKHKHENDLSLTDVCRRKHMELAQENGWLVVSANRDKKIVAEKIWLESKIPSLLSSMSEPA